MLVTIRQDSDCFEYWVQCTVDAGWARIDKDLLGTWSTYKVIGASLTCAHTIVMGNEHLEMALDYLH